MTKYTDGGLSTTTNVYVERQLLKHARPIRVLGDFGLSKEIPKNRRQTINFRRPRTFTAATVPLSEGVTPNATQFSFDVVEATVRQYGQVSTFTDHVVDTHEDPVVNSISEQLGENVGRTFEALDLAALRGGTNVFYANGTQRTDVNTPINNNKLRAVVKFLKAQKAMMITKVMDGSINFATRPIEAGFIAVCHTDLEPDLRALTGFTPVAQYGGRKTAHENEFGTVENVRFITTPDHAAIINAGGTYNTTGTMVSTGLSSADIYPILIFGKEAYGTVALRGQGAVEPSVFPPKKSPTDPLGQRGVAGWVGWHVCKILNDAWIARLEVACTDVNA
jgi:N4-gp56 family major capsid protein